MTHRDYRSTANVHIYVFKDRVEVVSPGGLPAGMTEADLGVKSMPRNPLLFGMLYRMGVVENIGSGIRRIHELCREHGVAKPTIDASEHWLTVTFPRPAGQVETEQIASAGTDRNRISNAIDGKLEAEARSEGESGPESGSMGSRPASSQGQSRGPESGPESRPESRPESGPESLELRVLALLVERPLSRSGMADGLGHQSVSAGLKRVIRDLLNDGRIVYTIPDKPNSRLQRYRITPAGQSALEDSAK